MILKGMTLIVDDTVMMRLLIGFVIGGVSGFMQFILLAKFTESITSGAVDKKTVLIGVSQFFLPLAVLLGCAFLFTGTVIWAAAGMVTALILCAVVRFIRNR